MECTLHNLLTSCQYPQVFWIYQMNDYDENILLTKGTKQEMLEDEDSNFDLLDHINDIVEHWTIREDGAMFVRIRADDRVKELFSEDYVNKWDRYNPLKRPYLYSAEMDDFTHCIYGSAEYLHPYGDPNECYHWADRKTEPTISKMEQVDKDINVRSKDELMTKGVWNAGYKTGYDKGYKDAQKVKDSQDLVKDLVKAFGEDGTWLERQGVYTMTLAEAKQRAVDIIESVLAKDEPTTQTETQNSNLTFKTLEYCDICDHKGCKECVANALDEHCMPSQFKKQIEDECAKEYEELGLKELKELIKADRKTENSIEQIEHLRDEYKKAKYEADRMMDIRYDLEDVIAEYGIDDIRKALE